MMKRILILALVLGLASGAQATLSLVDGPADALNIGATATATVNNNVGGAYTGWLEIVDPTVLDFDGAPVFTAGGSPDGQSSTKFWPDYGAWYEFNVTSFSPGSPVLAGDHLTVKVVGLSEGTTSLNLYDGDGVTLLDTMTMSVVPEPVTIALLGLGGLFLRRRK